MEAQMQKWEYLFVKCGDVFVEDWRPKYVNGNELNDWQKGPTIMEYCKQAGIRGWEMISFTPGQTGLSIVFKRPFEGQPGTGTLFQQS
jgi:hypothetical protein